MYKFQTILGATTVGAALLIANPSFGNETTAGAPAEAEASRKSPQQTIGNATGWPSLGEDEAAGSPWGAVLVIFGVLGAAGVSSLVLRKNKSIDGGDVIEVLATKTVAPRTKIVLISARNREVLITINDKGATLLTEWLAEESHETAPFVVPAAELPRATEHELQFEMPVEASCEPEALLALSQASPSLTHAPQPPRKAPVRSQSEAVAGLLELRKKAQRTPVRGQSAVARARAELAQAKTPLPAPAAWPQQESAWTRGLMEQLSAGGKI